VDDPGSEERFVALRGCFNFRDLGGYPTADGHQLRWRTLYRSGGLDRLEPSDVDVLRGRGLRTVVDLRSPGEVQQTGPPPAELGVTVVVAPMTETIPGADESSSWSDPEKVAAHYRNMLQAATASVATAMDALARPGALPAVFHCSIGKDRTGVLAGVLLGALGVPDDVIVADYVLSREPAHAFLDWLETRYSQVAGLVDRFAPVITSVDPQSMAGFLAGVRQDHGSFDRLIRSLGAGAALDDLRRQLVA